MAAKFTISDADAKEAYRLFHSGEAKDQRSLSLRFSVSKGTLSNIVLGRGRFATLKEQFAGTLRPTKPAKAERPKRKKAVRATPVLPSNGNMTVIESASEDPVVDLAFSLLERLPGVPAVAAVAIARYAGPETMDLLSLLEDKPDIPLLKYLTPPGRPRVKAKSHERQELKIATEIAIGKEKSDELIGDK
jgi:hypothetical protein